MKYKSILKYSTWNIVWGCIYKSILAPDGIQKSDIKVGLVTSKCSPSGELFNPLNVFDSSNLAFETF